MTPPISYVLFLIAGVAAAPVVPGSLREVSEDQDKLVARPGDVVVAQILGPVTGLDVSVTGGLELAGSVFQGNALGGRRNSKKAEPILIFVSVGKKLGEGKLQYSFKDGDGKEHKRTIAVIVSSPPR